MGYVQPIEKNPVSLFGGTSFFGMATGSRGRHKKKRGFDSPSNERTEEIIEQGVAACESGPGELSRRRLQAGTPRTFSKMFGGGSRLTPVKGGIRKFTK